MDNAKTNPFNSGRMAVWALALLMPLLLLGMVAAGCTSPAAPAPPSSVAPGPAPASPSSPSAPGPSMTDTKPADKPSKETPSVGSEDVAMSDNKTGMDKTNATIAAALLADGTYSKMVTYAYHSGTVVVNISVTVKDDVITSASVATDSSADKVSEKIVGNFNAALPELVVGKKINELSLPKNVAGSSLTTAAFKGYVEGLVPAPGAAS